MWKTLWISVWKKMWIKSASLYCGKKQSYETFISSFFH